MRFFAIVALLFSVSVLNLAQTTKPKPKTQPAKTKATETPKEKLTAKPKPAATPTTKPSATKSDEDTTWEKAISADPREARITALQKFNKAFPKSAKRNEALTIIAFLRTGAGNEKLSANDVEGAAAVFKSAAADAPKPISDQLWNEALSKIAANLYFRGAREDAIEIEKILESKVDVNARQLLDIANFYIMIENGGEARRVSLRAIALEPDSSVAYQTVALANRIDFELSGSASAYEQALKLDPTSIDARRGLAEMKRAFGKPDEAETLYREILSADANNLPAQTGLILALFDAEKTAEAETELAKSLEANPGNVILLAGAAYWYASRNNGAKAIELAQRAIDSDPRFIWSHIALARGMLSQSRVADAERTLLAARRYGNFPTLEYELASARLAAGYYREAAEGLSSVFKVKEGRVSTRLGGRVERDAQNFIELIRDERRASIFAPTAADNLENATSLAALLDFKQQIDAPEKNSESIATAVDKFVKGGDRMTVYRQIFAATQLLEKRTALPKVLELTKAAASAIDSGLDLPNASIAVMANELYEGRAIAATKGEYIVVPNVPRTTLSAVLRGRLEEIAGWANYNLGAADDAIVRLRRAVSVLPADSIWWRSSTWRLGAAYALAGKDSEALDMYIKSYKSAGPDAIRYGVIEALYRKVNGSTDGLSDKIGPNPAPSVSPTTLAQQAEPSQTPLPRPTPDMGVEPTPVPETKPVPSIVPPATPTSNEVKPTPVPTSEMSSTVEAARQPEQFPKPSPTLEENKTPQPSISETPSKRQVTPTQSPQTELKSKTKAREVFPPVIITIPAPDAKKDKTSSETNVEPKPAPAASPTPTPTPEAKPCTITVSEETINLNAGVGKMAVLVGLDDDGDVDAVQASSSSVQDVTISREPIAGLTTRALFVLRSISDRLGVYQVTFQLPCGKRTVTVNVR